MMASGRFNLRAACVHTYGNIYVREFQARHSSLLSVAITEYPESHHLWRVKVYLAQSLRSCGKSRVGQLHQIRVSCYHVSSMVDTWCCQGCKRRNISGTLAWSQPALSDRVQLWNKGHPLSQWLLTSSWLYHLSVPLHWGPKFLHKSLWAAHSNHATPSSATDSFFDVFTSFYHNDDII